jgi:hypothetical protein
MKLCPAQNLLDQLDGATISTSFVEDEEGLHVCLQDGRILVVAGYFALSIIKSVEKLH